MSVHTLGLQPGQQICKTGMRKKCFNILYEMLASKGYAQRKEKCRCEYECPCMSSIRCSLSEEISFWGDLMTLLRVPPRESKEFKDHTQRKHTREGKRGVWGLCIIFSFPFHKKHRLDPCFRAFSPTIQSCLN